MLFLRAHTFVCLLLSVLAFTPAAFGADASDEIDANWSPEMSQYLPAPQNWPLCGDIVNHPNSTWSEGEACSSTIADRVVSTYGPRPQSGDFDFHRGIDLRSHDMELDNDDLDDPADPNNPCDHDCVPHTRPVFAVADATEYEIEYKCKGSTPDGFRIELLHEYDDGTDEYEWTSRYVHLSSVAMLDSTITAPPCPIPSGTDDEWEATVAISAGQHIGYTGKSRSNNHHLHFEVRKNNGWARDAVHPQRMLPDTNALTGNTVSLLDFGTGQPEVEVDTGLVDVVRVELHEGVCTLVAGTPQCSTFVPVPGGQQADGYIVDPPYFDYERMNHQYSHRGSSVWTNTNGFQHCPFSGDHGSSYKSDLHLTKDDTYEHTFNGVHIEVFGGVTPYKRQFRFDEVTLPWDPGFDYTCFQAVVETAANGTLTSEMVCRSYAGGPFEELP